MMQAKTRPNSCAPGLMRFLQFGRESGQGEV
jgi:hypothetical protein